jgi:hypothetical protein
MKYAVEMGSGGNIYIPSFLKIGSGIQRLIGGIHRHTDTQTSWRSHKPTLISKYGKQAKKTFICKSFVNRDLMSVLWVCPRGAHSK